jgi:non-heme chloroperoxidase
MPYFKVADQIELFYTQWGVGHPVLFIHGGNVGSEIWNSQIPGMLEKGYQCILYDQRGFSRSDTPGTGYDFDTLAADLHQFIEHLNLHRFSVVTFSFGACVLSRYLSSFGSEKVDQVTMIAPATPFFLKTPDNPEGLDREIAYEPFRAGMIRDRPQIFRDSIDAFFSPSTAENPVSEGLKDWLIDIALQNSLMAMLELYRITSETDFREDMKAFTMPTQIIHGDADVFLPAPVTGMRTHQLIPGSKFTTCPGASHGILFTHRDRINHDIAAFIESNVSQRELISA